MWTPPKKKKETTFHLYITSKHFFNPKKKRKNTFQKYYQTYLYFFMWGGNKDVLFRDVLWSQGAFARVFLDFLSIALNKRTRVDTYMGWLGRMLHCNYFVWLVLGVVNCCPFSVPI